MQLRSFSIGGVEVTPSIHMRDLTVDYREESMPKIELPSTVTITMSIKGGAVWDMLCPAAVKRTRSGAWLVKGRGPTRRYSTQALAVGVARARDRRYAAKARRP